MKQQYTILRSTSISSGTPGGMQFPIGPSISSHGQPEMTHVPRIEIEELEPKQVARVTQHNDVLGAAVNMPTKLIAPVASSDNDSPGVAAAGDSVTWGVEAVQAVNSSTDGSGIIAAVLDTGIDINHPAFAGMNIVQKDFTGEGDGDAHGHGTHCAGTVFGQDVDGKRIGVARGIAKGLIGKVLGSGGGGGTTATFHAIEWASQQGANVISMSLGIDFPGFVKGLIGQNVPSDLATSMALEGYRKNIMLYTTLAAFLRQQANFTQTCIIIAAAGNENRAFEDPSWDIAVAPPAAADGIISVGALGQSPAGLVPASFSNSGPNISGPGVGIESAKAGSRGLTSMNGTSMATPHVSGVAAHWAQWLQARGQLTPTNLEGKIIANGTTGPLAPGTDFADVGMGLVQTPMV